MRKLVAQRHIIKQNLLAIIGVCLFCYFSYHALLGARSYNRLMSLDRQIIELSETHKGLHVERTALEEKVSGLRPNSLDKDLLEERSHYVLGYYYPDEKIILR